MLDEPQLAVELAVAAATDAGLKRATNEDSLLAEWPVFAVADGMGGYEAGDRASASVVEALRLHLCDGDLADVGRVREALDAAVSSVEAVAATTRRGAGSTLTAAMLVDRDGEPHWLIVNIGDSRVYRLFGGELEQLTVDHSLAQELWESGRLTTEERRTYAERNVITRALGAEDSRADTWLLPVTTGERLLVCSDGLHGELDDDDIRSFLGRRHSVDVAARSLVDAAKLAGGRDNITVVVVDVLSGGLAPGANLAHTGALDVVLGDAIDDPPDDDTEDTWEGRRR